MLKECLAAVFNSKKKDGLSGCQLMVDAINALASDYKALSDEALHAKTHDFKQRLSQGSSLDDILVEAFAAVREAASRVLGLRHFDVQLLGGIALHQGKAVEIQTGEGKTLTATLPAYLNALLGKGVHVITTNNYLAQRDCLWMKPVYEFLGLTVGLVVKGGSDEEKHAAYRADITYGVSLEIESDFLRNHLKYELSEQNQTHLHYAIVDEIDFVLIDEAKSPAVISKDTESSEALCRKMDQLVSGMTAQLQAEREVDSSEEQADCFIDEENRQVTLTEKGYQHVETWLRKEKLLSPEEDLYQSEHAALLHCLNASLYAHALYERDVNYVVKDNEIVIIDQQTGRLQQGHRWLEGVHLALEAKEGLPIRAESKKVAVMTSQNFFRSYDKLCGMSGSVMTETEELKEVYGLESVSIPPHKPNVREDYEDEVYLTQKEKYAAIVNEIKIFHNEKQPVLVGTASVESSELLSKLLAEANVSHEVINAKRHEQEAKIIVQAGYPGAVTIATNMAGRGVDIVLGGNLQAELEGLDNLSDDEMQQRKKAWQERHETVVKLGGLHVIGVERHDSRRIDNQLRGRAGRQGDPGSSQFFVSLEDNLLRIFASDKIKLLAGRLPRGEGGVIRHPLVSRSVEKAQSQVKSLHFAARKALMAYDDVLNEQREAIYEQRQSLLEKENIKEDVELMCEAVSEDLLHEMSDDPLLKSQIKKDFGIDADLDHLSEQMKQQCMKAFKPAESKKQLLELLDKQWSEYINAIDLVQANMQWRAHAHKNPMRELQRESLELFNRMVNQLKYEFVSALCKS